MAGRVVSIALVATDRMSRAFRSAGNASDSLSDRLERANKAGREFGEGMGAVVRAGAMVAAIPSAGPLAAGLGALAPAAGAAALGIGSLAAVAVPSINRIKEALAAEQQAQKASGAAAAQSQARAMALAGAQQALKSAVRDAADAHKQALQRVKDAELSLSDAQRDAKQAQEDLNDARREAAQDAKDLAQRVSDAQFDLKDAALSVAEAEADYQKTLKDPEATELQKKRAALAVEQAKRRQKAQQEELKKLHEQQKQSDKEGVDGSQKVKSARDALAEANRRVAESERKLSEARANVAKTDAKSAEAVANARRAVAAASLAGAGGTNAYAQALAKLSPYERKLLGDTKNLKGAFDKWQLSMQPHVLPLLSRGLKLVQGEIPSLTPVVIAASGAMSGLLDRVEKAAKSSQFAAFKKQLTSLVGPSIAGFGNATLNIIKGLMGIISAFMPAAPGMLKAVEGLTARFATWGSQLGGSSGFKDFMEWARSFADILVKNGPQMAKLLSDVANAIIHVGQSLTPVAGNLALGAISSISLLAKAVSGLSAGQIQAIAYAFVAWKTVEAVAAPIEAVASTLSSVTEGVQSGIETFTTGKQAVTDFVGGFRDVNRAFSDGASRATELGAAMKSQLLLWRQQAAAQGVSTARIIANAAAQKIAAAATRAWAAIQAAFNAVMSANPIALIVIGLVLLGVALFIAFKKVGWFHNAVMAAWAGIKVAAAVAWAFLKTVLSALWGFIVSHVVPVFVALWRQVQIAWVGIRAAIASAWAAVQPVLMAIVGFVRGVLVAAWPFLLAIIKIVWIAIQIYIKVAWLVIKGYFTAISWVIRNVVAPVFRWLYTNVIKPVWNWIKNAIRVGWLGIKFYFAAAKTYIIGPLASVFRWLWNSVIKPVWSGIKNTIATVWTTGIRPIFGAVKTALGAMKNAFRTAVDGIGKIWSGLKSVAKVPVNFVIGIYNKGIRPLVNGIAGLAGVKTRLDKLPTFAHGGVMPGYAPGKDTLLAAVSPGESIFRPEFTKGVGSGWVQAANTIARKRGPLGVRRWLAAGGTPLGGEGFGFSRGGTVPGYAGAFGFGGIVGDYLGKAKDWALGNASKAAKAVLDKILNVSVPGTGLFHDLIQAVPTWIKNHIFGWLSDKSGGGTPGMKSALAFAKSQSGKPYLWGGVGPSGYDCSGFMSALTNVIKGKSPHSRLFTTHSFGSSAPSGFVRGARSGFEVGVTDAGVGHMAGTLLGVNVESNGSQGVHYGPGARGAHNGLFPRQYGLKADTGALALGPGWNPPTYNGTGRVEYLETPRRGAGREVHIYNHGVIGSRREMEDWLVKTFDTLDRKGRR